VLQVACVQRRRQLQADDTAPIVRFGRPADDPPPADRGKEGNAERYGNRLAKVERSAQQEPQARARNFEESQSQIGIGVGWRREARDANGHLGLAAGFSASLDRWQRSCAVHDDARPGKKKWALAQA